VDLTAYQARILCVLCYLVRGSRLYAELLRDFEDEGNRDGPDEKHEWPLFELETSGLVRKNGDGWQLTDRGRAFCAAEIMPPFGKHYARCSTEAGLKPEPVPPLDAWPETPNGSCDPVLVLWVKRGDRLIAWNDDDVMVKAISSFRFNRAASGQDQRPPLRPRGPDSTTSKRSIERADREKCVLDVLNVHIKKAMPVTGKKATRAEVAQAAGLSVHQVGRTDAWKRYRGSSAAGLREGYLHRDGDGNTTAVPFDK